MSQSASIVSVVPEAPEAVHVDCVTELVAFTALRREWNDLLKASSADCPFLTWEWQHAWWLHLRGTSDLHLLTVRARGMLIALAPFRRSYPGLPWFSQLEFLGTGEAGSDYLDVIVRRGWEGPSRRALSAYLHSQGIALRLAHVRPASDAAFVAGELADDHWTTAVQADGTCPIIPLARYSWDSYLDSLKGSHRANFRRQWARLEREFTFRFTRVASEADRRESLSQLAQFHEDRWGATGSSAFSTASVRAFQDDVTRRALSQGWLRMYVLRLNDTPAAVMYGFTYGGRFYFYQHGFDRQFQRHSLGVVLIGLTVRAAIEEGAGEFDMLWGVEPYKFLWAGESRSLQRVDSFPARLAGRVHQQAIAARRTLATFARRWRTAEDPCAT